MKKEKRQKLPSRRKRTLRRILIAAAAVLLVNRLLLIGLLFPIQAVRHTEERMGTGRTSVVCREWVPEIHWSQLLYLTENEHVTMLSGAQMSPFGWMDAFGVPLDCSEEAPIYGGWWSIDSNDEQSVYYVFGRIDNPDITYVKVQAQYEDSKTGEVVRRTAFEWGSSREDWAEKDGRRYFLLRKYPMDWGEYPSPIYPVAIGYDASGNEIARAELDEGASSHFFFNAD